jgi:hypothetical protein
VSLPSPLPIRVPVLLSLPSPVTTITRHRHHRCHCCHTQRARHLLQVFPSSPSCLPITDLSSHDMSLPSLLLIRVPVLLSPPSPPAITRHRHHCCHQSSSLPHTTSSTSASVSSLPFAFLAVGGYAILDHM